VAEEAMVADLAVAEVADLVALAAAAVAVVAQAAAGNKILKYKPSKNNHMKKTILVAAIFAAAFTTSAQAPKLPAGTKFKVVTESNNITSMSMMGQDIELTNGSKIYEVCELKSVSGAGYHLSTAITRIAGSVNAMGNEQKFDSLNDLKNQINEDKIFALNYINTNF
jgi:FAD synthase